MRSCVMCCMNEYGRCESTKNWVRSVRNSKSMHTIPGRKRQTFTRLMLIALISFFEFKNWMDRA